MNFAHIKALPVFLSAVLFALSMAVNAQQCFPPASWTTPHDKAQTPAEKILSHMAQQPLVFLGEHHANQMHHQWHIDVLRSITAEGKWVLGLESFPRRHQAILNQWLNRTIDDEQFLTKIAWDDYWSFPFEYYRPLLELARDKAIPVIALNVDRELIRQTGRVGWDNIPVAQREGVIDPQRPNKAYIKRLAVSFQRHNTREIGEETKQKFKRFVEQQLLWDGAMAQAVEHALLEYPNRNMVSVIGSWHLIDKLGVPLQLSADWRKKSFVAIPWDSHLDCNEVSGTYADVIYTPSH